MDIIKHQSPNFNDRLSDSIDMLVLHSTHMTFDGAINRLCNKDSQVSSHYLIDLNGSIYQLVEEKNKAWHAGQSYWRGRNNINEHSIGIEIVDKHEDGTWTNGFNNAQIAAIIALCKDIISRHKINPYNVVAHSDIAPSRKQDPGKLFDWKLLAQNGVGLFPYITDTTIEESTQNKHSIIKFGDRSKEVKDIQQLLHTYGYNIEQNMIFDKHMLAVTNAFNLHFNPVEYIDLATLLASKDDIDNYVFSEKSIRMLCFLCLHA